MTKDTVLQLVHSKTILATSIPASLEGKLGFLGVYPIDPTWPSTIARLRRHGISVSRWSKRLYRVRAFEVDRRLVEAEEYVSVESINSIRGEVTIGDEDLRATLEQLGVRLDQLDLPSQSNYPL